MTEPHWLYCSYCYTARRYNSRHCRLDGACCAGRSLTGMDFSDALKALKDGQKVTREGWNGPGQWVAMSPGFQLSEERVFSEPIRHALVAAGEPGDFLPYLMLRTAQGAYVPWLASQTDLLANDWQAA